MRIHAQGLLRSHARHSLFIAANNHKAKATLFSHLAFNATRIFSDGSEDYREAIRTEAEADLALDALAL